MAQGTAGNKGRWLERFFVILASIILGLMFFQLYAVFQKDFKDFDKRIGEGSMINLNTPNPGLQVKGLLQRGFYLEDRADIELASAVVTQGFSNGVATIDNIGELNKKRFFVLADQAFNSGGTSYKKRVLVSRSVLGFSGRDSLRYGQEKTAPPQLPQNAEAGLGKYSIDGTVRNDEGEELGGVLVRLNMILPRDSLYNGDITDVEEERIEGNSAVQKTYVKNQRGQQRLQALTAYARTNGDGEFRFSGLPDGKSFEVLPMQPGYQFGNSKGVVTLDENVSFSFYRTPHTIRLFSTRDFNNLKKELALVVRTPEEVMQWFWIIVAVFFGSFFLLHLFLSFKFPQADGLILPVVMLLTGLSLITLISLQDPLRDRYLAQSTLGYFGAGMAGIFVLLLFNLRYFTTDSALYRLFFLQKEGTAKRGWQWAALAIVVLLMMILFGTGPEGSGVKVNLFGFQPSEVVKLFMLLFLAGFFAANEKFIASYVNWKRRWSFFGFALAAIVVAILLFLILGDLGPAMVVCFTFIILFSFSRGDFADAIGAVVLYVLAVWALQNAWLATGLTALVLTLFFLFIKKQISESAIMALVVMAGFLLLDEVPFLDALFPGPVGRLIDRKAIWNDAWNNEVFGGDHVANGIWAMSSGGITGQGLGEGFAKTIPEAHTDMILPSLGEELGWMGIVCIFLLFLVYLHRSISIGRQTGTPFLFYLCAGIGISTFVQFLLIAGGSTGALPLSGVSLPFISYGGSSLIVNLIAAGFLLSASNLRGTEVQMKYITKQQDKNLIPALVAAVLGVLLLIVNVSRYLFNNDTWIVQPALVADRSGARMFSYNPRIAILMNRLEAGQLYDRKGALLATSKKELVLQQRDTLVKMGLDAQQLVGLSRKRLDRYYPFGAHMFFWTGDANTGIYSGGTNGYFAEYEHAAALRGFETPLTAYNVTASRFKEDRFLPQTTVEMNISKRDFSVLAPLLLAGINSKAVDSFKKQNRDLQLAMDARLQTALQQSIALDDSLRNNRVSVVIMEDSTGDVLASAMHPLPPVDNWELMNLSRREQNSLAYWITLRDLGFTYATQPGSTVKIATALAAFNKFGVGAANKTYLVREQDRIRISGPEPDQTGTINMRQAIVNSNNVYFIRLANEERLQEEMATLYLQTGMFLRGVGGYFYGTNPDNVYQQDKWRETWRKTEFRSLASYDKNNIRASRGRGVSGMSWGQGELIAAPAAVARMAAGISNKGVLMPNRYVLKISDSTLGLEEGWRIAKDTQYTALLTSYMKQQSANKRAALGIWVAGKTGTPERIWKGRRINDGWYVFFAPKASGSGHVVVCIRIEGTKGSSNAVRLAGKHVIPQLLQMGYIKGFEAD